MSLSNGGNGNSTNPCKRYYEWSGSEGKWFYYDKEAKQKVFIDEAMYFIMLDELTTVKGYSDADGCGIFANEVKDQQTEELNVRVFNGGKTIAKGVYANIKDAIKTAGGKYCKSMYVALISTDGKEVELVNFQFFGSSVSPCIDAQIKADGSIVTLKGNVAKKKGSNNYFEPVIKVSEDKKDAVIKLAMELDKELQVYLGAYSEAEGQSAGNAPNASFDNTTAATESDSSDLPF